MVTIYALTCLENGFAYVGCTKGKLAKRLREHRCLLKSRTHTATLMQRDWDCFGEARFTVLTLEVLPVDAPVSLKRERETFWMDSYSSSNRLYNAFTNSFAPTPEAILKGVKNAQLSPGNRWTPEANEKRRLAQLGKPKGHGAKISATKRAKQAMR